jgi:hypothetical protein
MVAAFFALRRVGNNKATRRNVQGFHSVPSSALSGQCVGEIQAVRLGVFSNERRAAAFLEVD